MESPTAIFQVILLLHIGAAIVGFGGMIAQSAYNARAYRSTAGQAAPIFETTKSLTNLVHYGIYAVFVFGLLLVVLSSGEIGFGEPWISASFVIWFLIVGVAHGLVKPAINGLAERAAALEPSTTMTGDTEADALAKKLALGEGLTQMLLVLALAMMIWQFGG